MISESIMKFDLFAVMFQYSLQRRAVALVVLIVAATYSVEATYSTRPTYPGFYPSCKAILAAGTSCRSTPSGEYSILTSAGRVIDKVYCEMGLNGGGYTFLRPFDLPSLTTAELRAMFTDTTSFILRARLTNGTQPYGVLKQLPQYSTVPLALLLNSYTGYSAPLNAVSLGSNYLLYGFTPSRPRGGTQQVPGLQVNGRSISFASCPGYQRRVSSYIAIFPNFCESLPSTNTDFDTTSSLYDDIFSALCQVPSGRTIPDSYYTFSEFQFGGCPLCTNSAGLQANENASPTAPLLRSNSRGNNFRIIAATIGFR